MGRYIARRFLKAVLLLLAVSVVVFMFSHLLPGDPARQMAVGPPPEEIESIREEFGLDKPGIVERFKNSNSIKSMFFLEMGCTPKFRVPTEGSNMKSSQ